MKQKIALYADMLIFTGWTAVGLLNFVFFIVHASPANLSAFFAGDASASFTFMGASAIIMLLLSTAAIALAVRRKPAFERLRSSLAWRLSRVFLTAFAALFIAIEALIITASFPAEPPAECDLLILGAHVTAGGQLSITLRNRLIAGAEYAAAHPGVRVIVSGGQGLDEPESEAQAMRRFLVSRGVAEERIITEDKSHNTFENLSFVMDMLPDGERPYPVIIVTSEFHICRTAMLAARAGFKPHFIAAATPRSILPSCYSREFFGLVKSFFLDR